MQAGIFLNNTLELLHRFITITVGDPQGSRKRQTFEVFRIARLDFLDLFLHQPHGIGSTLFIITGTQSTGLCQVEPGQTNARLDQIGIKFNGFLIASESPRPVLPFFFDLTQIQKTLS